MSLVKRFGCGWAPVPLDAYGEVTMDRAQGEAEPETSVGKLLYAGWIPQVRVSVRGCLCLGSGVDRSLRWRPAT